tara:strand:- start:327 stop:494 length:168 start_codon:yes stop_codon:yes gene_type:complete
MSRKTQLTSVNVDRETHREFKILCIKENITFQQLVNAAVKLYITDEKFRKIINKK